MKADDKIIIEEEKQKYTNFDYLKAKVEILQDQLEFVTAILKQNNLVYTEKKYADIDIEDETFKLLEEDQ